MPVDFVRHCTYLYLVTNRFQEYRFQETTTAFHVFDRNIHNTHLYDENEILLQLCQSYFEMKTASCELFVFYSQSAEQLVLLFVFGRILKKQLFGAALSEMRCLVFGDTLYLYCVSAAADDDKVITDRDDDGVRVQALELNCRDSWSSHTLAHVYEMRGEYDKGLSFLENTVNDWQVRRVNRVMAVYLHRKKT